MAKPVKPVAVAEQDTSKDWRYGSKAGRADDPTQPLYTSGRARNAEEARQPIHTSKPTSKKSRR
ncbi:hypothetical protein [Microtetraspora malaysiensis]|uniref:hypothetical protein n=1 Tax=Microtetraspora malaysiensis TaxID=161358 RepID=UPI003D8C8F19